MTCEPRASHRPTVAGKAGENPRTPSVVPVTAQARRPTRRSHDDLLGRAFLPCTDSPSLHPRAPSAALRASSWLAPGTPWSLADSRGDQARDASDRRLPPEPRRETVPRVFPARCRGSRRVETTRSLRLRAVDRGTQRFTTPWSASAGLVGHATPHPRGVTGVGVVDPRRPSVTEPLTPLSPPPLPRIVLVRLRARSPREEAAEAHVTSAS